MSRDFLKIIDYAAKAPSGHNTQPWKFRIMEDGISIKPDFDMALPIVDPDNRELYISLGCAAENLVIASGCFGYEAQVTEAGSSGINITLAGSNKETDVAALRRIDERQTNRNIYTGDKIPGKVLEQLKSTPRKDHGELLFIETGTPLADTLTSYIVKGNEIQMDDTDFKEELLSWMRFNASHIQKTSNGLSHRVFGNPPLPCWMGKPVVRLFLNPNRQNQSDKRKIRSSSHLVLFTTTHDTVTEWINLGRTLQLFLLRATGLGISCAFLNQPCEVKLLAGDMQKELPVNNRYPTLILRIGYAASMPYSPRKKAETLVI